MIWRFASAAALCLIISTAASAQVKVDRNLLIGLNSWGSSNAEPPCLPSATTGAITINLGACTNPLGSVGSPDYYQVNATGNITSITLSNPTVGQVFSIDFVANGHTITPFSFIGPSTVAVSGNSALVCRVYDSTPTYWCPGGVQAGLVLLGSSTSIWNSGQLTSGIGLSGGNLIATLNSGGGSDHVVFSTPAVTSGKRYFQATLTTSGSIGIGIGTTGTATDAYLGFYSTTIGYYTTGNVFTGNGAATGSPIATFTTGAAICVAIDQTVSPTKIWFQPIGSGQWDNNGTDNPDTNTGGFNTSGITSPVVGGDLANNTDHINLNFATPCAGVTHITTFSLMP